MSLNNSLLVLVWLFVLFTFILCKLPILNQPVLQFFNNPFYHHTVLLVGYVFFFLLVFFFFFFFGLILLGYEVGLVSTVLLSICIAMSFQRI